MNLKIKISASKLLFAFSLATIGAAFLQGFLPHTPPEAFARQYGKEVEFVARVSHDPVPRAKDLQLFLTPRGLQGNILVSIDKFSSFAYGDIVNVQGVLKEAPAFEDFNYQKYLQAKKVYALMFFPQIELLQPKGSHSMPEAVFGKILELKHRFRQVVNLHIPAPESALLGALLLGDQSMLSSGFKQELNATGLRHIVAISGQHVVILTNMLMALFLGIGLWKQQALLLSFSLMLLFILLTGLEASAIRAGIMGGLLLLGQYLGRMHSSFRALTIAAAVMLLDNPLLLTRDVGFQLSFLAVFGIIFSFSFFKQVLRKVPQAWGLQDMLAMNFSAQVFTLPLLVYNFGYVSLISPLTNILVLPIVPFLVGVGFVFLLGGAAWSLLGTLLSFPVFLLAFYFHFIAEFSSRLPFATIALENLSPLWLIVFCTPIIFFIRKFQKENPSPPLGSYLGS